MAGKTWFITGTSRGFGREWANAALERGDRVAATARDTSTLDDLRAEHGDALLALALDVTDRDAAFGTVAQAHQHFGRLDIVVNNAGYGHFGTMEEISEQEAALPFLREQGGGHIVQVSSIGGISAFPTVGMYHASKWGLEGFSQALAQEVSEFGIHVTLVEPGGFSTDWSGASAKRSQPIPAYDGLRERQQQWRAGTVPGDPAASAAAIMRVVDADPPPLRVFFGTAPLAIAENDYASRLATWREWQPVSELAQGPSK